MSGVSPAAQALWHFYFHAAHRVSSFRFVVSERVVEAGIGLSPNTARKARAELMAANLIRCERGSGGGAPCIVNLINPESGGLFADANGKAAVYAGPRANKPTASASPKIALAPMAASPTARTPQMSRRNIFDVFEEPAPPEPPRRAAELTRTHAAPAPVVPPRAVTQDQSWRCYSCKGSASWQRADGSRVCAACHPNPEAVRAGGVSTVKDAASPVVDSEMNEHGLPEVF